MLGRHVTHEKMSFQVGLLTGPDHERNRLVPFITL